MEALFLASVTARSAADAARTTESWRPLLDELARLGDELDAGREVSSTSSSMPHRPATMMGRLSGAPCSCSARRVTPRSRRPRPGRPR